MLRTIAPIVLSVAAVLAAIPTTGQTFDFASGLSPEVAGATGTGSAQVTFDTTARTLAITATGSGLTGLTTISHIHCCVASPGTVGVAVTPGTLPGFPTGVSSGSYSTLLDLSDPGTYTANFFNNAGGTTEGAQLALLTGLQSRQAYFNIHTNAFPGGEIRGFLSAVPEPQSWSLMILGFGLLAGAMRRRRGHHSPLHDSRHAKPRNLRAWIRRTFRL